MATAGDIVTRALQLAGVVPIGRTPGSKEATDGLNALNDMLAEWKADGIGIHVGTLATGDTLAAPDEHIRAIRYNLAVELAGLYGSSISPRIEATAERGMAILNAAYLPEVPMTVDRALWRGHAYDIDRD